MRLRLIEAPAAADPVVTLAEARTHLEILDTARDDAIEAWITAATEQLDGRAGILGRALVTQKWELLLDTFPCASTIAIPLPPLRTVESITYVDSDGATQTLATSVYAVDTASEPGVVSLKYAQVWPATRCERNAVSIQFTAGYGAAAVVPERLKSAIKLMVGDLFANREASGDDLKANPALQALIFPFKVF